MIARVETFAALALLLTLSSTAGHAQAQTRDTTRGTTRDTTRAAAVTDLPLTAAQRQAYVGVYSVSLPQGEQTMLNVYEENGILMAHPENQDESRKLVYQGDNVFLAGGDPEFAIVFVVENGHATKFTVRRADGVIQGVRVH